MTATMTQELTRAGNHDTLVAHYVAKLSVPASGYMAAIAKLERMLADQTAIVKQNGPRSIRGMQAGYQVLALQDALDSAEVQVEDDPTIDQLLRFGNRWTRGNMDRIYFNNIASYLPSRDRWMAKSAKVWFDLNTQQFRSNGLDSHEVTVISAISRAAAQVEINPNTFICDGCGGEFPGSMAMSASLGRTCPDCYDSLS